MSTIPSASSMRSATLVGADDTVATLITEAAARGEFEVSVNASVADQVATVLDSQGYATSTSWGTTTISWAE